MGSWDAPELRLGDHPPGPGDHLHRHRRGCPGRRRLRRTDRAGSLGPPDRPLLGAGRVRAAGRAGGLRRDRRVRHPAATTDQARRRHGTLDGHDCRGVDAPHPGRGGGGRRRRGCGRRDRRHKRQERPNERQDRPRRPVTWSDRRLGRRRERDPDRHPEQGPDVQHVRTGTWGRLGHARPAPTRARPRRRHRRQRFAARPRTASSTSCRRSRCSRTSPSRSRPAATRRPTPGTRRSSSRSWRASASRPGSSAATPARS